MFVVSRIVSSVSHWQWRSSKTRQPAGERGASVAGVGCRMNAQIASSASASAAGSYDSARSSSCRPRNSAFSSQSASSAREGLIGCGGWSDKSSVCRQWDRYATIRSNGSIFGLNILSIVRFALTMVGAGRAGVDNLPLSIPVRFSRRLGPCV